MFQNTILLINQVDSFLDSFYKYIHSKPWLFLIPIMLTNFVLKGIFLADMPYWLDEANNVHMALESFYTIIADSLNWPNSPGYTLVLGGWVRVFGVSEFSTRMLSLIFHVLTIPVIFFTLKNKFKSIQAAIFVVILFSISILHIYYSHESRGYTLISFLSAISFYLYFDILENPNWKNFSLFSLIGIVLLYVQLPTILLFGVQFFCLFFKLKSKFKASILITLGHIIAAGAFSIWLLNNTWLTSDLESKSWLPQPDLEALFLMFRKFFNTNLNLFVYIAIFVGFGVSIILKQRWKSIDKQQFFAIVLWGIFPIIAVYFASMHSSRFIPRYMLFASLGLYSFVAIAISFLEIKTIFKTLIMITIVVHALGYLTLNPVKGEQFDVVAEYIHEQKTENTMVIVSAEYQFPTFSYYYNRKAFENVDSTRFLLLKDNVFLTKTSSFFKHNDESAWNDIILVYSHQVVADKNLTLLNYLREKYKITHKKTNLRGVQLYHFENTGDLPDLNNDTILIDFENQFTKEDKSIVQFKKAHSGSKVAKSSEVCEYSAGYEGHIPIHYNLFQVDISIWAYSKLTDHNAKLVYSIENKKGEFILWKSQEINLNKPEQWQQTKASFFFPDKLNKTDLFKVYVWNKGSKEVLVDDLKIIFK